MFCPVGTKSQQHYEAGLEETLKKNPRESWILVAGAGEQKCKFFCAHLKYSSQDFTHDDRKSTQKDLQAMKKR